MSTAAEHKAAYQAVEDQLVALQEEKDAKIQAVKDEYGPKLKELRTQAEAAQKVYLDREAAEELESRIATAKAQIDATEEGTLERANAVSDAAAARGLASSLGLGLEVA